MRPLVILRPEPGASATAARARKLGIEHVIKQPLFSVSPVSWAVPDPESFDALVLTSANAIRHGGEGLGHVRRLPVFAVGEATAEEARGAGFDVITSGIGGLAELVENIPTNLRLLHLCGTEHFGAGRAMIAVPVYSSRAIAFPNRFDLPAEAVVAIHSPRAGKRLAELVAERDQFAVVAISARAAEAAGDTWQSVRWTDSPIDDTLLALAKRMCQTPDKGQ